MLIRCLFCLLLLSLMLLPTVAHASSPKTARAGDISIAWSERGSGDPLLLIAGYGTTRLIWEDAVLDRLAERYRVIVFDNRGMGDTEAGTAEFTIRQFAEDAYGLVRALGIGKCRVLGWSMGSLVAQELALAHPESVERLVLYASYTDWSYPPSGETIRLLSDESGTPEERGMRWVQTLFPSKWLAANGRRVGEIFMRPLGKIPGESVARQQEAIGKWGGSRDRLAGLGTPTLLLCGKEDILVPPENSLLMAGLLPKASLRILPEMGHGLMFQDPESFCSLVLEFLEGKME
jgi:pimeloyl-ACP methyl ester carboxylesterase